MKYNIYSWNVNGIRAAVKKGFLKFLQNNPIDILCIQETKAQPEQLDENTLKPENFYTYWISAEKKGYSGVAIFSKIKPETIESSINIEKFDKEGRIIIAKYPEFTLINVYFPNGKASNERLKYKMEFYDKFLQLCNNMRKNNEKIIVCGDVNTAHREIDLKHPKPNSKYSGFLPEERAWIDKFLESGFIDSFRYVNGDIPDMYTWWSMRSKTARPKNVGWRIDYFFVSKELIPNLKNAKIHPDIMGSDHCPISITLEFP